jgi:hypothetical protein
MRNTLDRINRICRIYRINKLKGQAFRETHWTGFAGLIN